MNGTSTLQLFGLTILDSTLEEAAAALVGAAHDGRREDTFFVNAHCVNVAAHDPTYRRALQGAQRLYADGSGMRMAARWAGRALRDNVNGTDLFPLLCRGAARAGLPIALLGARPGVAERCAQSMRRQVPGLEVAWVHHGYMQPGDEAAQIAALNRSGARLLFVAMGVPAQELWLQRQRERITVPVTLAVGALFDFYSGDIPRAPSAWRRLGVEWLYRLLIEPRRLFMRYVVGNPRFLARALWLRLRGRLHAAPLGPG